MNINRTKIRRILCLFSLIVALIILMDGNIPSKVPDTFKSVDMHVSPQGAKIYYVRNQAEEGIKVFRPVHMNPGDTFYVEYTRLLHWKIDVTYKDSQGQWQSSPAGGLAGSFTFNVSCIFVLIVSLLNLPKKSVIRNDAINNRIWPLAIFIALSFTTIYVVAIFHHAPPDPLTLQP